MRKALTQPRAKRGIITCYACASLFGHGLLWYTKQLAKRLEGCNELPAEALQKAWQAGLHHLQLGWSQLPPAPPGCASRHEAARVARLLGVQRQAAIGAERQSYLQAAEYQPLWQTQPAPFMHLIG